MAKDLVTRLLRVALAAAFALAFAPRASASSIVLSNLDIQVDDVALTVSVRAGLLAQADVVLEGLLVNLIDEAQPLELLDVFAGPTLLNDLPFLDLPASLLAGESVDDGTLLFQLTGLLAETMYSGSFALIQGGIPLVAQTFEFTTAASTAPVPEPATLVLTGFGAAALLRRRLRTLTRRHS